MVVHTYHVCIPPTPSLSHTQMHTLHKCNINRDMAKDTELSIDYGWEAVYVPTCVPRCCIHNIYIMCIINMCYFIRSLFIDVYTHKHTLPEKPTPSQKQTDPQQQLRPQEARPPPHPPTTPHPPRKKDKH